jgi:hypothetical protein
MDDPALDEPALDEQSKPNENLGLADTQSLCESTPQPTPSSSPSQETQGLRCIQCPELSPFKRRRDFNKHRNKHLRPYRCEEGRCNQRFSTSTSAKRHHRSVHRKSSTKQLFFCPYEDCPRHQGGQTAGYTRKDSVARHIRQKHREEMKETR